MQTIPVADFSNDSGFSLGEKTRVTVPAHTKALTVLLRCTDLLGAGVLLSWLDDEGGTQLTLLVDGTPETSSLAAKVFLDSHTEPLQLTAPLAAIDADHPHTILLRYLGHRLELFVDDVLLDEEWPHGSLRAGSGEVTVSYPGVEKAALWFLALGDTEGELVGAGAEAMADQYLGVRKPVAQYWRPRGLNVYVGDCMPFFHDGRFHLFYLLDRRQHGSKWGLGAHQWAHVSTIDLVQWDEHPLAIPITREEEGSICTGSVFFWENTYHAFYAIRTSDYSGAPLCVATSQDGIHFSKHPPLATLTAPYSPGPGRDPVVFRDAATGLFHMLVTTELVEPPVPGRGGCLAHLVSSDLRKWEQREPFLVPGYPDQPECPDYFEWNGWYYLVFSNGGVARYRMSRQPFGPWLRPPRDQFEGPAGRVMKTAPFVDRRRIGAVFIGSVGGYGGELLFRELIQLADGTLGTKWVSEMVPASGKPLPLDLTASTRHLSSEEQAPRGVHLSSPAGIHTVPIGAVPRDFLLRARVSAEQGTHAFGVHFRADEQGSGGLELRFEPQRQKVGLRAPELAPSTENEQMAIYNVPGLEEAFEFGLLVKENCVDVCLDGPRTLINRIEPGTGRDMFLFAQDGTVTFEWIEIRPLAAQRE